MAIECLKGKSFRSVWCVTACHANSADFRLVKRDKEIRFKKFDVLHYRIGQQKADIARTFGVDATTIGRLQPDGGRPFGLDGASAAA